jgi:hypothetical protein
MFQKLLLTHEYYDERNKEIVRVFDLIDDKFKKEVFMKISNRLSFADFHNAYSNILYDIYYAYKASSEPTCKNMELVIDIFGGGIDVKNTNFYKRKMRKF